MRLKSYATHVLNEVKLGITDNLHSLKNMFFHPIQTVFDMLYAFRHPITTIKNILQFAYRSPIRFGTGVGLSVLEGRVVSGALQKASQFVSSSDLMGEFAEFMRFNSTMTPEELLIAETAAADSLLNLTAFDPTNLCTADLCAPRPNMLQQASAASLAVGTPVAKGDTNQNLDGRDRNRAGILPRWWQ